LNARAVQYDFVIENWGGRNDALPPPFDSLNAGLTNAYASLIVPDLVERIEDFVVPSTGDVGSTGDTIIVYSKDFTSIGAIAASVQDDAVNNGRLAIIDKTVPLTPTIKVYDINGAQVTGLVDILLEGY